MASNLAKVDLNGRRIEALDGKYPGSSRVYNTKIYSRFGTTKKGSKKGRAKNL